MLHYILDVAVSDSDVVITLDTARYTVAPDDVVTAAGWYGSQQVEILPSHSLQFPVRLHHSDTGQVVKARRLVEADGDTDD